MTRNRVRQQVYDASTLQRLLILHKKKTHFSVLLLRFEIRSKEIKIKCWMKNQNA